MWNSVLCIFIVVILTGKVCLRERGEWEQKQARLALPEGNLVKAEDPVDEPESGQETLLAFLSTK